LNNDIEQGDKELKKLISLFGNLSFGSFEDPKMYPLKWIQGIKDVKFKFYEHNLLNVKKLLGKGLLKISRNIKTEAIDPISFNHEGPMQPNNDGGYMIYIKSGQLD